MGTQQRKTRHYRRAVMKMFEPLEPRLLKCGSLDDDGGDGGDSGDNGGSSTQPVDTQPVDTLPGDNSGDNGSSDSDNTGDNGDTGDTGDTGDNGSDSPPSPPDIIYPPDAPSHVTLQNPSSSSIFITWQEDSGDADGFQILRFDSSGRWKTIATVGGGTTSYTDTHLTAGSEYTYSIVAFNGGGYSDYSSDVSLTIPLPSDPTLIGQFGHLPGGPASVPFSFVDSDGTQIMLVLSGSGSGMLHLNSDGYDLSLTDTTLSSSLTIHTTKSRTVGDDGRFDLSDLTGGDPSDAGDHTGLGSLSASTTDLLGDLTITGGAKTITLGNLEGGNVFTIGAPAAGSKSVPTLSLQVGTANDATVDSSIGISKLTAVDWTGGGAINAPFLNSLNINGNKTTSGDFDGDLDLSGVGVAANKAVLGAAHVSGNVTDGTWDIGGNTGGITINGQIGASSAWELVAGAVQSLSLGDVLATDVTATGAIGGITAQEWLSGAIDATTLSSLRINGRSAKKNVPALAGNFGADVTLTGSAKNKTTLNQANLAGQILGGAWQIAGGVSSVSLRSVAAWNLDLSANGNFAGNLGSLNLTDKTAISDGLTLSANALQTLNVAGNLTASQITLDQLPDPHHIALNQLTVKGTLSDFVLRSVGNVGTISAGMLDHAMLFAGVLPEVVGLPRAASDFAMGTLPGINMVAITGLPHVAGAVLIDSDLAAGSINHVSMPKAASAIADPDNDALFGFATVDGPVKKYSGPVSNGNFISGLDSQIPV